MPSSAEPVQPTGAPTGPTARIFQLDRHDRRVGRQRSRRPAPPPPLHTEPTPQQRLAETMEALFLARDRTLTDEPTAEAYRTTLDAVMLMLDGSLAEHLVGEEEHRHLTGMIQGMQAAPNEL
ncbi:hypothetical protein OH809_45295 (plasmid) [Streptomyces sp. NBC_00873]|uniref:hypothetical protein n=1 Tax=Streptomyces sp. NBC_00873 TaxID=2975852 RepID=UPI003866EEC5|nr:hypothetical protein OH809_45295 [Streptomyces sp. NBC_00873]